MKRFTFSIQIPLKERLESDDCENRYVNYYLEKADETGITSLILVVDGGGHMIGSNLYDLDFTGKIDDDEFLKVKRLLNDLGIKVNLY